MKFFKPTPKKGYPKPKPKPEYVPDSVKYADPSTRELIKPAPLPPPPEKDSIETLMEIMQQANGVIRSVLESAKKQNDSLQFILKTLKTMSQNHLDLAKRVAVLEEQPLGEVVFDEESGELLYEWPLPSPQGRVENPENN